MTRFSFLKAMTAAFVLSGTVISAELPENFPGITVTIQDTNRVAGGHLFLAVASVTPGVGTYQMILRHDGTPVWYEENTNTHEIYDFKVLPNGHLHSAPFLEDHSWTGGGDVVHEIRDESYRVREVISGGNGYVAESHDFLWLPNGHVLLLGYYMSEVDVSEFLEGGHPAARISGGVVQELDGQRNVVWQWRSWDHFDFSERITSRNAVINAFHLNDLWLDIDGQLIVGTPGEIWKIDRQTGDILWTLGGEDNEFTPVGDGASVAHWGGHGFHRLGNGNFLMYDNGNRPGTISSKVYEYRLDEGARTATLVWSYTPAAHIPAWHRGNAQRLSNGNTLIGWGGAQPAWRIPACTEVTAEGEVVYELYFGTNSPPVESYRAFRFDWPPTNHVAATEYELAAGNDYVFGGTGVSLRMISGGGGYNEFTVRREPYAPVDPLFPTTAPRVLPVRIKLSEALLPSLGAMFSFEASSLGFDSPELLTVYHRSRAGQGLFVGQSTEYNPVTGQLRTTLALTSDGGECGELIFGYPDRADVPFAPLLAEVENYRGVQEHEVVAPKLAVPGTVQGVNQDRPILLSWSPKGFARWYELEIAEDESFEVLTVREPYLTDGFFIWSDAAPGRTYHYRVRTQNDGGTSEWSVGAFSTEPPGLILLAPEGGEHWQRGREYYIRWWDNLAEGVAIDLYRDGILVSSLATNARAGAPLWEGPFDLEPDGGDTIRLRSGVESGITDGSDGVFSLIDSTRVEAGTVQVLPNGGVEFAVTVPGGTKATVHGATDLGRSDWQVHGVVTLTDGSGVFTDLQTGDVPWRFYRVTAP